MLVGQRVAWINAIRKISIPDRCIIVGASTMGYGEIQLQELKRLQKENERLRIAVSDLTLDKLISAEAARTVHRSVGISEAAVPPASRDNLLTGKAFCALQETPIIIEQ